MGWVWEVEALVNADNGLQLINNYIIIIVIGTIATIITILLLLLLLLTAVPKTSKIMVATVIIQFWFVSFICGVLSLAIIASFPPALPHWRYWCCPFPTVMGITPGHTAKARRKECGETTAVVCDMLILQ